MNAGFFWLTSLGIAVSVVLVVGAWKTFEKAGQPGWAVLIPVYNYLVALRVAQRPWWWLLLLLIPVVNVVLAVIVNIDVSRRFGKGVGFGLGMWLLPFVFIPILGFGASRYERLPAA